MVDDGRTDGRRTDDGRTTEHGYTISSPCEPDGSGELKRHYLFALKARIVHKKSIMILETPLYTCTLIEMLS